MKAKGGSNGAAVQQHVNVVPRVGGGQAMKLFTILTTVHLLCRMF